MPVTFICPNGHLTTAPGEAAGRTVLCATCGEPAGANPPPTRDLSETTDAEPAERPALRPQKATSPAPAGRKWPRVAVIAGALIAVAGIALGAYRLTRPHHDPGSTLEDREGAREVATRFMERSRRGDEQGAKALFTDRAQAEMRKGNDGPETGLLRPGVTYEVGDAAVAGDTAEVPVTVREAGGEQSAVLKLRRQGPEWRVYGMSAQVLPGDPGSRITFDFENPQNLAKEIFGIDPEAWGREWERSMKPEPGDPFSLVSQPDDLANEALAPIDRGTFNRTWMADLDVADRPAGEVLKELVASLKVRLETSPAQDRALARPVTLQLRGKSRRELTEEVCRTVGLYPTVEERFALNGKGGEVMTLRPGPRPLPVAFAGPFLIEVTGVHEYAPHTTGLLVLRATAVNLPPAVGRVLGIGQDGKLVGVTAVTDARDRNLSADPAGPRFKFGRTLPDGYDRTFELPLKNLLRDVTAVKSVRGVVRVPLPTRIDTLRFEPPAAGAAVREGTVEVKMANFRTGQTNANGKQYPYASFRLDYKGVRPDRVRVVAYGADQKLLAVSSAGWNGSDTGGSGDFTVQGEPAAVAVKVISAVEFAEYGFALENVRLSAAAGMPEKLVPAAFPGHDDPLSAEFVRITSPQFPAKAQFRLTNHSDKDVRAADVKLVYLDAAGRELKVWPNVTHTAPDSPDGTKLPLLVEKNATALAEIDAPFLPDGTRSIRAEVRKVAFADASEWAAPTPKK